MIIYPEYPRMLYIFGFETHSLGCFRHGLPGQLLEVQLKFPGQDGIFLHDSQRRLVGKSTVYWE